MRCGPSSCRGSLTVKRRYLEKGDIRYKIIKYRPMGVRSEYAHYQVPDRELMEHLAKRARECGMKTVLVV